MTAARYTATLCAFLLLAACSKNDNATSPDGKDMTSSPDQSGADMAPVAADMPQDVADMDDATDMDAAASTVRVATFNASLFRSREGQLRDALDGGEDAQAKKVAEVIQRVRPDVILINEFDWDSEGASAKIFSEQYLAVSQNGAEPLAGMSWYVPPTNTGVHSGADLDNSGRAVDSPGTPEYGNDAFGFGTYPGQYGMAVFSNLPIQADRARTFQELLWEPIPNSLFPFEYYSPPSAQVMRLSSKNHVDVPVSLGDGERSVHLLISHPTPPSFDGDEDRNGRRNHDEIAFWSGYLSPGEGDDYHTDDAGVAGGLAADAAFVILGDLNSDPVDGDSRHEAIEDLLAHDRVQDVKPGSEGAVKKAMSDGGANTAHAGDHALDTADFGDGRVGNLRVDYVLPSKNLNVVESGVFWPAPGEDFEELAGVSDHHLVWIDVEVAPSP